MAKDQRRGNREIKKPKADKNKKKSGMTPAPVLAVAPKTKGR